MSCQDNFTPSPVVRQEHKECTFPLTAGLFNPGPCKFCGKTWYRWNAENLLAKAQNQLDGIVLLEASPYRLPDGTWCCTKPAMTTPCGDCDGCRYVAQQNEAS